MTASCLIDAHVIRFSGSRGTLNPVTCRLTDHVAHVEWIIDLPRRAGRMRPIEARAEWVASGPSSPLMPVSRRWNMSRGNVGVSGVPDERSPEVTRDLRHTLFDIRDKSVLERRNCLVPLGV